MKKNARVFVLSIFQFIKTGKSINILTILGGALLFTVIFWGDKKVDLVILHLGSKIG